jgi:antitoxin (DNA-binding transcriptional repressor) of toxin-antitoxin stability system
MTTLADIEALDSKTRELINQVKLGNDVLLTQANTPIARIIPFEQAGKLPSGSSLKFKSFHLGSKGPLPSKSELADEMIEPQ